MVDFFGGITGVRKEIQDRVSDIKRELNGKVDTINSRLDKIEADLRRIEQILQQKR